MTIRPRAAPKRAPAAAAPETVRAQDVVDWLRERIRVGRLAPGQRLIEADIVRETHASRGRVREALQQLATEGLVTLAEFKGASVKSFTRDEIRQIYRIRMALEGLAAHDCAAEGTADLKRRLKALQDQLDANERRGNHERFAQLNDDWHRLIISGSGNVHIETLLERLRVPVYRLVFTAFFSRRRLDDANAGHRRITAAIVAGDADAAERLMRAHVAEGFDVIQQVDGLFFA